MAHPPGMNGAEFGRGQRARQIDADDVGAKRGVGGADFNHGILLIRCRAACLEAVGVAREVQGARQMWQAARRLAAAENRAADSGGESGGGQRRRTGMTRRLHLNLFIHGRGHHEAAWRHPSASPLALTDIRYYTNLAQTAEAGLFDSVFLADTLAAGDDVARA